MAADQDALRIALEALEHIVRRLQMDIDDGGRPDQWSMEDLMRKANPAINALRSALSEGEQQIGWEYRFYDMANEPHHWTEWEPLKPKFRGHEHVQEMRDYIASGYRYQMRPIYAGPAHGYDAAIAAEKKERQ